MNVPPPPPPPPPAGSSSKCPAPSSNKALLSSIEKGTKLKKVPDSLKNDRSSVLVGTETGKASSCSQKTRPVNGLNSSASDQNQRQPRVFQSIQSELANQLSMLGSGPVKKPVQISGSGPGTRPQFRGGAPPPNQLSAAHASSVRPPPPPPSTNKPMLSGPCPVTNSTTAMPLLLNNRPGPPPPVASSKPHAAIVHGRAPPPPQPLNKKPVGPRVPLLESGRSMSASVEHRPTALSVSATGPVRKMAPWSGQPSGDGAGGGRVMRVTGNPPPPMPSVLRDNIGVRPSASQHVFAGAPAPPVPQRVTVTSPHARPPPPPVWGSSSGLTGATSGPAQYSVQDRPPPPPIPGGKQTPPQRGLGNFDRRFNFPDERLFPRRGGQSSGGPPMLSAGSRHSLVLSGGGYNNYR